MFSTIRRYRAKPKAQLVAVIPELVKLRTSLLELSAVQDPLIRLVNFFQIVSPWHDCNEIQPVIDAYAYVDDTADKSLLSDLQELQAHFNNAGRNEHGWNRTKRGENVSEGRVYLGNIYGLFTKTVSYWLTQKDEPKGGWGYPGMEKLNAYDVVCSQAEIFMQSHVGPMVKATIRLENAAK